MKITQESAPREIEVEGVRLAVVREGRGPAVVCLHAIGHDGRDFETFAEAIKDRFEIIRIDWPGQGRSGPDTQPASAARYAALLAAALTRLGVTDPILLGNSIGAAAAIIHASRAPVRALVLCDSGGLVAVNGAVRAFTGAFVSFFKAGIRGAWWFRPAFRFYYSLVLPAPAARAQRERTIANCHGLAPVLAEAWESFGRPEADIRGLAAGLTVPVWFAWARADRVIPLSLCRPAIRAVRQASVTEFDGGHSPFLEQPQAFVAGFEQFVALNRL